MRQACGIETHGLAYRQKFLLCNIQDYVTSNVIGASAEY